MNWKSSFASTRRVSDVTAALAGLGLLVAVVACSPTQEPANAPSVTTMPTTAGSGAKPQAPILVEFSLDTHPRVGQDFHLAVTVQPLLDAPNTTVTVTLPQTVILVQGQVSWKGDLRAKETHVQDFVIRVDKSPKPAVIEAEAISTAADGTVFGRSVNLYLRVSEDGRIQTSETPFDLHRPSGESQSSPEK